MSARPDGRARAGSTRAPAGFTLVELMIVVFIIGILIALTVTVIPKVMRAVRGAQTSAQLQALASGIQTYYNDFRAYPGPLPNGILGGAFYSTPRLAGSTAWCNLSSLGSTNLTTGVTTFTASGFDAYQQGHITGSENLVLGLLGGLQYDSQNSTAGPPAVQYYAFNPNEIYPDNVVAAPKGAMNFGSVTKRSMAYMQVKIGDLSPVGSPMADVGFADDAGHTGLDSMIPEFLDKYSRPMPILYMRANVGTSGVASYAGLDESKNPAVYQYDLAQIAGYTSSQIGTLNSNAAQGHHGLQDVMPSGSAANPMGDTVGSAWALHGSNEPSGTLGANAFIYLKDSNTPPTQPSGTFMDNVHAKPRQKDQYILISAGPDGIYGTADDIVYPGGAVSP